MRRPLFTALMAAGALLLALTAPATARSLQAAESESVEEGPPITRIVVEENQRYSESQILRVMGIAVGDALDPDKLDNGLEELFRQHHVLARWYDRPDPSGNGVEIRIVVSEFEFDRRPVFVGNHKIRDEKVLEWAGLEEGEEVFVNQADRVRRRLQENYRRDGFYFAEVDVVKNRPSRGEEGYDESLADMPIDMIFRIREGPRVRVRRLEVHGNHSLPDGGFLIWRSGLRHLASVEFSAPALGFLFPDKFVEEVLSADLIAMRQTYRDRGWLDAVVEVDHLEFTPDREWVVVHISVDEGPRYKVSSLGIEAVAYIPGSQGPDQVIAGGQLSVPEEELLELCELEVGGPFELRQVRKDQRAIQLRFGEQGYLSHESIPLGQRWAWLDPVLVFDVEAREVAVTYRVAQGSQQYIREVIIRGAAHTMDKVARRYLEVVPGQRADLKTIEDSLARLNRSGYFANPGNPEVPPPRFRFVETADPSWKDLEYVLEDSSPVEFNIGGGFSSNNGLIGQASVSFNNFDIFNLPRAPWTVIDEVSNREAFHGAGQRFNVLFAPGTEFNQFQISFYEPDVFNLYRDRIGFRASTRASLVFQPGYNEGRREWSLGLDRALTQDTSAFLSFRSSRVTVEDVVTGGEPDLLFPTPVPQLLKDQEGESDASYLEMGVDNDTVDDLFYPRRGGRLGVSARVYDDFTGSSFQFMRGQLYGDWYVPFGDVTEENLPAGMRLNARFGASHTYGRTQFVPYTERFFLGGNSLRGFRRRRVGPNVRDLPVGGETSLNGSIEYRFPLVQHTLPGSFRKVEALRGILFVDAGVLDPQPWELDFDELRWSYGIGIGMSIGPFPITISYAFPQGVKRGDATQQFLFDIGFR